MLVDEAFKVEKFIKPGAFHSISIKNLQSTLVIKCKNAEHQEEWYDHLNSVLNGAGRLFSDPDLLLNNSYAPVRQSQLCRWYVNGNGYMNAVMNGLNNAKEEIFITDWWMSPEIFLKRPTNDLQYRLDKILLKKASEGVKVYVLLFKEVELALELQSLRTELVLTENGTNPNIKVVRHPRNTATTLTFWSHHEKCVVIDQSAAFVGGIDLCLGRWDDDEHKFDK